VFLRILEYFEGLMFLTTNKVKNIDEAMWSRIDYMKTYQPLSRKQKQKLFRQFLGIIDSDVGHKCLDKDINTLAEKDLNGREVNKVK
jgi:hypothetical protein